MLLKWQNILQVFFSNSMEKKLKWDIDFTEKLDLGI
jgi:hypothetical protein